MSDLRDLWQSPIYRRHIARIEALSPIVPVFDYKNQSNFEEIKFKLAQKQMFELIMSILRPNNAEPE